jgi:predicted nucleic acid-binding protein
MTKRIAFDTSIFVAHFEQQNDHPLDLIQGLVDDIDTGRVMLLVPTIVIAELFCKRKNIEPLELFLKSPSVIVCELTEKAAKVAGAIRDDCISQHDFKPGMPDTLIVATSQQFSASAVYTVDDPMLRLDASP